MSKVRKVEFDAVIVGGGGSGMRAALQLAQSGYKTAVITKVLRVRLLVKIQMISGSGTCMTPLKALIT